MTGLDTIIVESIVVELTVFNQAMPLIPPRWYSVTIILVQVLPIVSCPVATLMQVHSQASFLMVRDPGCGAAVVIVGKNMMVVDIQALTW